MSKKPASAAPARETELYAAAVAATAGAELKGASMPYTSVNGNMYSFLDKGGVLAIRLGGKDYENFLAEFAARPYLHETGTVLKEYVTAPASLLKDPKKAAAWLGKSLAYARTLKPKPSKKKAA
jgi:TfoX/Sxy family transcriptional regulator of competence genes